MSKIIKNKKVAIKKVKKNGWALNHASAELRKDRDIIK